MYKHIRIQGYNIIIHKTYTCTHTYIYVHIHTYTHVHTYIYTYIHTGDAGNDDGDGDDDEDGSDLGDELKICYNNLGELQDLVIEDAKAQSYTSKHRCLHHIKEALATMQVCNDKFANREELR